MIKLLVKFGDESKEIEFQETEISIGRATDNVLPLQDKKSSRKHAKIEKVNGEYLVNDLGSGNGTKVNGKDVNTHVLSKGDEIVIGLTTMFVLNLDSPAKPAVVAPPPVAVAAAAPPPPPPPPAPGPKPATIRASAESMDEARRKATRRALARGRSGGWVGTAASILVLVGIAAGGYYLYSKHEKETEAKRQAREAQEYQNGAKYREAEADFRKFAKASEADPVEDSIITEATTYADKHRDVYPEWDSLLARLKQRRNEQIGRDDLASVDSRIQAALRDRRFGDALQALKDLKAGTDSSAAGNLVAKVCDTINQEFKSIDDYGRKLADEKKYTIAADHYKLQAPRFKGTEHYRYLTYKPETLEQLKKAEAETATAKANKPAEDNTLAKAEPKPELPKPEPKPEPKEEPKAMPAMPKEPPKPAPAMPKPEPKPEPAKPKEPEKPKTPPPPPPPPPPKPEPKEEPKPAEPGAPFKKPDVLCDCKKIQKGVFCIKCDRMLATDDIRNGVCKRCEEKPKKIDLCVKKYYMVDGEPTRKSEKPILYEGKLYDFAYEDKARIVYYCEGCQDTGDSQSEVKHKPDCTTKNVIKVCSKSGAPPHGGEKK